jgi:hypothetical protein
LDGVLTETLAKRLCHGPLTLRYALHYATDVADSLRTLHEEGFMHGSVSASSVMVTKTGAQLLPPNGHARYTVPGADVSAFGSLLHEMLTGSKLSPRSAPPLPAITSRDTEKGIQIAATRLASKCLRSTANSASEMQKVLTEVRLLSLQARIRDKPVRAPECPALLIETPHPQTCCTPGGERAPRIFTPIPAESFLAAKATDPADPRQGGAECPVCGVPHVYLSRPRTWFETLLATWGSQPLRCHRCRHRYVVILRWVKLPKNYPLKLSHRYSRV